MVWADAIDEQIMVSLDTAIGFLSAEGLGYKFNLPGSIGGLL
jgi:hypothetical protein